MAKYLLVQHGQANGTGTTEIRISNSHLWLFGRYIDFKSDRRIQSGKYQIAGLVWTMNEETRLKISRKKKGRCSGRKNPMFGKRHRENSKARIGNAIAGRICIHRNGVELRVTYDELEDYLEAGWLRGRKSNGLSGKVWINYRDRNLMIHRGLLENYLSLGWQIGRKNRKK